MIEELFTYAKLQNDSYDIKLERCCLNKILLDSAFSFYHDFKAAGISPQVDICEEQLYILGNEASMARVFQNIIKNSLEHGRDYFKMQMERVSEQVSITFSNKFSDNDKINAEQVFDMFYKADSARSRTSTGLGLAIAKELISRMNGIITVNAADDIFSIMIRFKCAV